MGFFCLFVFKFTFSVRKTQSCVWREHLCSLCVHAMCTRCVRLFSFAFFGLFSERWRNLLTGNVSGGGQWRFWDRHKRHVSERRREKEGLFHVTLHSTKAQARGGTRRDMRPPRHSPLPPFQCPFSPPSHPIQPLYLPSTKPPQIFIKNAHAGIPSMPVCFAKRHKCTQMCTHSVTEQSVLNIVSLC